MKEITTKNMMEALADERIVVVEFYKENCPHCKRTEIGIREIEEKLAQKSVFVACNFEKEVTLSRMYDIQAAPTLLFFKEGKEIDRKIGFTHKLIIEDLIGRIS